MEVKSSGGLKEGVRNHTAGQMFELVRAFTTLDNHWETKERSVFKSAGKHYNFFVVLFNHVYTIANILGVVKNYFKQLLRSTLEPRTQKPIKLQLRSGAFLAFLLWIPFDYTNFEAL